MSQKIVSSFGKPRRTLPNRKQKHRTVDAEQVAMQGAAVAQLEVSYPLLVKLLNNLSRIPDPREPKKIKHKMYIVMLYGILLFMFGVPSRRQGNSALTGAQLLENLRVLFPEITDMPHQDTLCRLLSSMDVEQIANYHLALMRDLLRRKKFQRFLMRKQYLVAIDGTQKYVLRTQWDERYLHRKSQDGTEHYYAYVLEAVLVCSNGMVLPLLSEFLENSAELTALENEEQWKQDCELKAFYRLTKRLKLEFPKLRITLLLDGLYANGPVMHLCRQYKWGFMIVLREGSLLSVWEEVNALMRLDKRGEDQLKREHRGRAQTFRWVNGIEYSSSTVRTALRVNVVTCDETFSERSDKGLVEKRTHYAWLSSEPISKHNIHERCNLMARKRWLQENNFLKEKRQGYHYSHIFSHHWEAMKGYHYLMHIAHLLSELSLHSVQMLELVQEFGMQGCIRKLYNALVNIKLDPACLRGVVQDRRQLRLIQDGDLNTNRLPA